MRPTSSPTDARTTWVRLIASSAATLIASTAAAIRAWYNAINPAQIAIEAPLLAGTSCGPLDGRHLRQMEKIVAVEHRRECRLLNLVEACDSCDRQH